MNRTMERGDFLAGAGSRRAGLLEPSDFLFFFYLAAIVFLLVLFGGRGRATLLHLGVHLGLLALALVVLTVYRRRPGRVSLFFRVWYIPILYVFLFEEVGQMIHLVRPALLDAWVLHFEVRLFGGYPTVWLQSLSGPWLTEIMSLFYMSYYGLIPILGLSLYFRRDWAVLNDFILATNATFFFCFLHYLLMPVGGPVFFIQALPFELVSLRGGPLTSFEQWLFFGGAVRGGAFPSSHVAVAVVVLCTAIRCGLSPPAFAVTVTGLAISTVYNGYHYGIDVIYGAVIGLVFFCLSPLLNDLWNRGLSVPGEPLVRGTHSRRGGLSLEVEAEAESPTSGTGKRQEAPPSGGFDEVVAEDPF
ncbi:MAG: phosphatase PAP2 family protein [Deltaproteobacteria bacterium]|nr:phosphatase PAP2 family protein [Deltaproteobacteria bacterium]MBW2123940.1 phosphatase PAP2 family protein [Deltaproteobacteria bacterium]